MAKLAINGADPVRTQGWPTWPVHDKREVELITEVTESGIWSYDGPKEWEFGKRFAQFSGAEYGLCVSNGTVAIQLALEALDIGSGDEVIVPGLTWQATAAAVIDVCAVPILVDVEPESHTIDPKAVEAAITPNTKAILPVHLYGCMADMDSILDIAKKHNLAVIEDSAHSHGSQWNGKGAGALGDVGCFSMQQTKVMTSGEGGANLTNREDLFLRIYSLRNCGRLYRDTEGQHVQSGNYRITEFQAAILLAQLERLEAQTVLRDRNAQLINAGLAEIDGITPIIRRPQVNRQAYYCFVFRYDRDQFDGVSVKAFRQALMAEIMAGVDAVYEPLNNCVLYQPHTKRRYHWSEEYWKAIDPRRFDLPVCTKAYVEESVLLQHQTLMGTEEDSKDIVRAVEKIRENVEELKSIETDESEPSSTWASTGFAEEE